MRSGDKTIFLYLQGRVPPSQSVYSFQSPAQLSVTCSMEKREIFCLHAERAWEQGYSLSSVNHFQYHMLRILKALYILDEVWEGLSQSLSTD